MSIIALSHTQPAYTDAAILRAIRTVESGGNYKALHDECKQKRCRKRHIYKGCKRYHGFGAFGFQYARWRECGGSWYDWGFFPKHIQDPVMCNALGLYARRAGKRWDALTARQRVVWICNCHNVGHGSLRMTAYCRKVFAALDKPKKKGIQP